MGRRTDYPQDNPKFLTSHPRYILKKLKIRNKALRLVFGNRSSNPINVMLAEHCEPSFNKKIWFFSKKYVIRTFLDFYYPLPNILQALSKCVRITESSMKNQFVFLKAFESVKEFIHRIRRSDIHRQYEFPDKELLFSPKINIKISRLV